MCWCAGFCEVRDPCLEVLWLSGNGYGFELNVIYLNFHVIHGLSSVSGDSRVKGYGVCFAGRSWRSFGTGSVPSLVS